MRLETRGFGARGSQSSQRSQFAVGRRARFRQREEHVVLGVGDRHDRGAVADAAGPAGDLRDVEHGVAALDRVGVLVIRRTLWSERRIRLGTPTSSPRCSLAWPRRIALIQPKVTGKPPSGFQSRS